MPDPVNTTCEWPADGHSPSGSAGAETEWEMCGAPSDGTTVSNLMAITLHRLYVCGPHLSRALDSGGWQSHPSELVRESRTLAEWLEHGDTVVITNIHHSPPVTGVCHQPDPADLLRQGADLLVQLATTVGAPPKLSGAWATEMRMAARRLEDRDEEIRLAALRERSGWSGVRRAAGQAALKGVHQLGIRLYSWADRRGIDWDDD